MKKFKLFILSAVCSLSLLSCEKEGPAGPQGPAGSNGNANVDVQVSEAYNWFWNSSNDYMYTDISVPIITQEIFETGAVIVYMELSSGDFVTLPRTINYIGGVNQSQRYTYREGNVTVIFQNEDYSQFTVTAPVKFKIITIASE
jgi:hypothetical protein